MHFSALRGLTQPCLTAYCILHITYDPGISPGSANQCILGDMYLRSNLSRKRQSDTEVTLKRQLEPSIERSSRASHVSPRLCQAGSACLVIQIRALGCHERAHPFSQKQVWSSRRCVSSSSSSCSCLVYLKITYN